MKLIPSHDREVEAVPPWAETAGAAGESAGEAPLPTGVRVGEADPCVADLVINPLLPSPRYESYRPTDYDIRAVAMVEIGKPTGDGRWRCPFHDDRNPSLTVDGESGRFKCWSCGETGTAIDLVIKTRGLQRTREGFVAAKDALRALNIGPAVGVASVRPRSSGAARSQGAREADPGEAGGGRRQKRLLTEAEAEGVLKYAYRYLRDRDHQQGRRVMSYLQCRGLNSATIDRRQLGYWTTQGRLWPFRLRHGVVIPWVRGGKLRRLIYREAEGCLFGEPSPAKYLIIYRDDRTDEPLIYPTPRAIVPGRPLVIVEGEMDCMLLGQELQDIAGVITLGSSAVLPSPAVLEAIEPASTVYLGLDDDPAGRKSAEHWPDALMRVLPPVGTDWGESHQAGFDLRAWWAELIRATDGRR